MPDLSLIHAKTFLVVAALGVTPILTSCKRGSTREQREITEHFEKPEREKEALKKRIQEHFKDTPYTFEISQVVMAGSPKEGPVTKADLLELKFTLFIYCQDISKREDAKKIDQGLRSILSKEQYESAEIYYVPDSSAKPRYIMNFERMMEYQSDDKNGLQFTTSPTPPTPSESLPASEALRPE